MFAKTSIEPCVAIPQGLTPASNHEDPFEIEYRQLILHAN